MQSLSLLRGIPRGTRELGACCWVAKHPFDQSHIAKAVSRDTRGSGRPYYESAACPACSSQVHIARSSILQLLQSSAHCSMGFTHHCCSGAMAGQLAVCLLSDVCDKSAIACYLTMSEFEAMAMLFCSDSFKPSLRVQPSNYIDIFRFGLRQLMHVS